MDKSLTPMTTAQASVPSAHSGNNFDAIRILAATMVLVSHHYALTSQMEPTFFGIHSLGGLAVTIFFVISGYLVTASWQRDPDLWRFALRRFLRIWPALTVAIVLVAYVLGAWVTELPLNEYLAHRATADYLQGLWMQIHFVLPGVFEHNPYRLGVNGSLWTIPIEVRCYIVLGLAGLLGLLKYRPVFLLSIALFMAWFLLTSNADLTGSTHYGRELSAFFVAGAALYTLQPHWSRRPALWATAIAVAGAIAWFAHWRHTALLIGLPLLIIYTGTLSTPLIRRAGRWGDPSYGIYLFAFPIQQTVIHYTWPGFGFMGTLALALIMTTLLAYASWHWIEKQALRLKPKTIPKASLVKIAVQKLLRLTSLQRFCCLLALLIVSYGIWLIASWPGVLGQDSLAIMLEVESNRDFSSGKPAFWYLYNQFLYGTWRLVEIPIIFQLLVCALICARILNWMLDQAMHKSFLYCLFFVALAPSVMHYSGSLYGDGIYAISTIGMLFEVWRSYRSREIDRTSCWMLMITIPFAFFARPNGLISGLALIALAITVSKSNRWKLMVIVIPWCALILFSNIHFKRESHSAIYPLALYETVGFLEHRPMGLWERNEPRVTPKTITALTASGKSIEHISGFYDHYYWDPLVYFPQGPDLKGLPSKSKKIIIREFFKYNLWHNFPAFAASRINIFFYSAFADGGIPGLTNAENILSKTQSRSEPRFRSGATHRLVARFFDFSQRYRVVFWTPWVGLCLLVLGCVRTWQRRDSAGFVICGVLALHLCAVFIFSIAGEYRYLLPFFIAPLVLFPVLYARKEPLVNASSAPPIAG